MTKIFPKYFLFVLTIFFIYTINVFAATSFTNNSGDTFTFPYVIPFSENELQLLKKLDKNTILKLIKIAESVNQKSKIATTTSLASTTDYPTTQNPYYNPQTGKYQSTPVQYTSSNQNNQQPTNPYLPQNNPYQNSPFEKYFAQSQQQYGGSPTGGYDTSMQTLRPEDMKDLPKLGSGGESCTNNFGINGNLSGTTNRVKFDTNRLCLAFGKRIKVIDAKRGCGGPSRHCFGEAIDFEVKTYGDRKHQALLVVAFISLGYNIGSYEKNFPLHADHEEASKWKTWSRWAHTNGQAALPYDEAVRDALALIGMPAVSAQEFRSKYGNPSKGQMSQKAKTFLETVYGDDAAKFTPSK